MGSNPLFENDRENVDNWAASARFDARWGSWPLLARLSADARNSHFLRTLLVAEGYGDRALRLLETGTRAVGLATPGELPLGRRAGLRLSFDYRSERAATRYEDPATGEQRAADVARRERFVGEVGLALHPHSRLEIDVSLRGDLLHDRSDSSGSARRQAWSPRIALVWALTGDSDGERGFDLFGELGQAFKAPTLDQLYDPRPFSGPDGDVQLSNSQLEPQRSHGGELGARGRFARVDWQVVVYRLDIASEIDFDPASFRYANIGRSRHDGLEASWRYNAAKFGELRLTYARSRAEAGTHPGAQLKNIPRDVFRLGWNVHLGDTIELGLRQSLLAGRWADDASQRPLGNALRTDLRLARQAGRARLYLDILNLFGGEALELAYLLPAADGGEAVLHGFAPAPRAFRCGIQTSF